MRPASESGRLAAIARAPTDWAWLMRTGSIGLGIVCGGLGGLLALGALLRWGRTDATASWVTALAVGSVLATFAAERILRYREASIERREASFRRAANAGRRELCNEVLRELEGVGVPAYEGLAVLGLAITAAFSGIAASQVAFALLWQEDGPLPIARDHAAMVGGGVGAALVLLVVAWLSSRGKTDIGNARLALDMHDDATAAAAIERVLEQRSEPELRVALALLRRITATAPAPAPAPGSAAST